MSGSSPRRAVACAISLALLCVLASIEVRAADAGWFASGDTQLRADLVLLNDAEVIRLPVSHWPLPRAAVKYAMAGAKDHFATNNASRSPCFIIGAKILQTNPPLNIQAPRLDWKLGIGIKNRVVSWKPTCFRK